MPTEDQQGPELLREQDKAGWIAFRERNAGHPIAITGAHLDEYDGRGWPLGGVKFEDVTFRNASLDGACLNGCVFRNVTFDGAHLDGANLSESRFLEDNNTLRRTSLSGATLHSAHLSLCNMRKANLAGAQCHDATMIDIILSDANLERAVFTGANLRSARLDGAKIGGAYFDGALVYGISMWDAEGEPASAKDLMISPGKETHILFVDDIRLAQLTHTLIGHQEKLLRVRDSSVLVIGRFEENDDVMDALKKGLRGNGRIPIVFDFERPAGLDFTESILSLASLSSFVIADISKPRSVQAELEAIVPHLEIPVIPIIREGEPPYAMFADIERRDWVCERKSFRDADEVLDNVKKMVQWAENADNLIRKKKEARRSESRERLSEWSGR